MTNENPVSVLLVDDRPENLLALQALLEGLDLNIVKAVSGNEALAEMVKQDFAVALMDVQMPEMDGFETAELMRGSERTKHIPIIFVTALSTEQKYVFKGYETGAVDYLFKPVDPHILRSKVKVFREIYRQKAVIQNQFEQIGEKNRILEKQLAEIKTLKGLLPICANCKNIRKDDGFWETVEVYIRDHSDVDFSHGICPTCAKELYPDLDLEDED